MKRLTLFSTVLLLLFTSASAFAQQHKLRGSKNRQIIELEAKLDSLQYAYDALNEEYQEALEELENHHSNLFFAEDEDELPPIGDYDPDCIDSLLNVYYVQKQLDVNDFNIENIDDRAFTSSIPDEVYIERLSKINSYIPIEFNKAVKNSIILYTERKPELTSRILGLAPYYLPVFEEIFDQYGLPKELKAMAIIESALNPRAVSRARATGMWQFMLRTAKMYGLEETSFIDERLDPVTSCHAAAKYLKDSYKVFGDWSLAIASYNCGLGNVKKAIARSGGKTNFWDIYPYLPRETRGYIPAFIAALYVLKYYGEHGIKPSIVNMPAQLDTFHINKNLHLQQVSEVVGIPLSELQDVNPQYIVNIIPGNEHTCVLNIPAQYSSAFVEKEKEVYSYKDTLFFNPVKMKEIASKSASSGTGERVVHKVKSGETLGGIAKRYHVTVNQLKNWNGLKGNTIRVGQRLYIYGRSSGSSSGAVNTTVSTEGYVVYTVRKGDTLSTIASRNGVSLSKLFELNGMNKYSKIYPGMKIRIKKAS